MWAILLAGVITALMVQASYISVPRSSVEDFHQACRQAGLLVKQAASLYGSSEQVLYQQLRGQGHLSLWRLWQMKDDPDGRRFLRHYMPLVLEAMGLPIISPIEDVKELRDKLCRMVDQLQVNISRAELAERDIERKGAA